MLRVPAPGRGRNRGATAVRDPQPQRQPQSNPLHPHGRPRIVVIEVGACRRPALAQPRRLSRPSERVKAVDVPGDKGRTIIMQIFCNE